MATQVLGSAGEPIIIILIHGLTIKQPLNDLLLYPQINAILNPHLRSFYLQLMVTNAVTCNWPTYRE